MPVIDLQQVHKTVCKYCGGKSKQSLVPANFVCGACKKFCEQQLSGEELSKRNDEVEDMINNSNETWSDIEDKFICNVCKIITSFKPLSHQQYLSVCRILRKVK
jgi:hypothetical protein